MANIEQARIHRGPLGPKGSYGGLAPISENEELMQSLVREREGRSRRWGAYATISALCGALMVAGLVYRASADDSATSLGSADLVAKEQYERAVTRYELGLIKGHITQSAGELYDSLPFNTNHGQCALEENQCDKYYLGTFQYVDGACTHGEPGGIGCVVSQDAGSVASSSGWPSRRMSATPRRPERPLSRTLPGTSSSTGAPRACARSTASRGAPVRATSVLSPPSNV